MICVRSSLLLVLLLPALAAAKTPLQRTQELITTFQKLETARDGKPLDDEAAARNQIIYKQLDDFYDFDTLASAPLEPYASKLTPAELSKIKPMFEELLRLVAYPRSGDFLTRAKYKLAATEKATDIRMDATNPREATSTNVTFHWQEKNGALRIVDVSFEGVSLILDYKNQFDRIIAREGGAGLVKKLSTRLQKARTR